MKHSGYPLLILLAIGMMLSACNSQMGGQPGISTATITVRLSEVESFSGPATPDQEVQPAVPIPSPDKIGGTESVVLEIPYTRGNPLTDVEEIQEILDRLQEQELTWFSRPGWYQFTSHRPSGRDYTRTQSTLVHVINENRECLEQFVYFEHEEKVIPFTIRLDDGALGSIIPALEGRFREDLVHETSPACDLGNGVGVEIGTEEDDFILHDEASQFRKASNHQVPGIEQDYRTWVEGIDGRQTLILVYDITIGDPALRGTILDPTTRVPYPVARNLRFYYINLDTGLQVRFDEEFYLENDQLINGDGVGLLYSYEYSETMPEELRRPFENAARQLKAMLDKIKDSNP